MKGRAPARTVAYQGEPGAFSEEAVRALMPQVAPVPRRTFRETFAAVTDGAVDVGVVPIENSQAGSINETYDLLATGGVWIIGEAVIRIDHALLALPGTSLADIRRVSSHPQALSQCEAYLAALDAEIIPVYDTAGAARHIAEAEAGDEAAVASERAADLYGLEVVARRIQTNADNYTRFVAIAAAPEPLGPPDKTSLVLGLRHVPGSLYRSLRPFAERGLNLTKLESRPLGEAPFEYRFYLDVEAGGGEPALVAALEELRGEAGFLRVVGSYPRWWGAGEEKSRGRPGVDDPP